MVWQAPDLAPAQGSRSENMAFPDLAWVPGKVTGVETEPFIPRVFKMDLLFGFIPSAPVSCSRPFAGPGKQSGREPPFCGTGVLAGDSTQKYGLGRVAQWLGREAQFLMGQASPRQGTAEGGREGVGRWPAEVG